MSKLYIVTLIIYLIRRVKRKKVKLKSLSHVQLFGTPWTVAYQAPPSMRFSRQEHWSGLPLPSPGDLPNPGIESGSPIVQADALPSKPPGKSEYIMWNAGLDEAHAGSKTAGRNINNLRYADDTTLMAESKEKLKSLLMKVKWGESKSWLKTQHSKKEDHGIWSHHFMADRWGNNRNS